MLMVLYSGAWGAIGGAGGALSATISQPPNLTKNRIEETCFCKIYVEDAVFYKRNSNTTT
jgi:hypothetical protein